MRLKDKEGWRKSVEANLDHGYGEAVILYAEAWANVMEGRMLVGDKLEDIAKETSHAIDRALGQGGMTGFQYGAAVSLLAQVWQHGEALRRWHNLDTQLGTEGERANEEGGTLNLALLRIGKEGR